MEVAGKMGNTRGKIAVVPWFIADTKCLNLYLQAGGLIIVMIISELA
ncbi:MAG: hypothetical protein JNM21_14215 [Taibaiella sp.]|nr:hypothetical protein [Taibaiella sp.]